MKKLTNELFLKKANEIHNNEFIYLDEYLKMSKKIKIKCKKCDLNNFFNKKLN